MSIAVPFDFNIRRILLPDSNCISSWYYSSIINFAVIFLTSNNPDLRNSMRVSQNDTNLWRCSALSSKLANLVNDLIRSGFQPGGWCSWIWDGAGRYALAIAVHATHLFWWIKPLLSYEEEAFNDEKSKTLTAVVVVVNNWLWVRALKIVVCVEKGLGEAWRTVSNYVQSIFM